MKIYKYPLLDCHTQILMLYTGYKILDIQNQAGRLVLWALVDNHNIKQEVIIKKYDTGDVFKENGYKHIATVQQGTLVSHFFEVLCRQI